MNQNSTNLPLPNTDYAPKITNPEDYFALDEFRQNMAVRFGLCGGCPPTERLSCLTEATVRENRAKAELTQAAFSDVDSVWFNVTDVLYTLGRVYSQNHSPQSPKSIGDAVRNQDKVHAQDRFDVETYAFIASVPDRVSQLRPKAAQQDALDSKVAGQLHDLARTVCRVMETYLQANPAGGELGPRASHLRPCLETRDTGAAAGGLTSIQDAPTRTPGKS